MCFEMGQYRVESSALLGKGIEKTTSQLLWIRILMTMIRKLYGFDDSTSIQIALANEINGIDGSWAMEVARHIANRCDFRV